MQNDLEIKHLKDTIISLREELEKRHYEEGEHVQQAVADANAEIRHLRGSVAELRDQLELREADHEQKMQGLELQHQHELQELRQTIEALRKELEDLNESSKGKPGSAEATTATATTR
jgi:chromosome segregation ATPase